MPKNIFKEKFLGRNYENVLTLMGNHSPAGFTAKQLSVITFSDIWTFGTIFWTAHTELDLGLKHVQSYTLIHLLFRFHSSSFRSSFNFLFRGIVYRNKRLKHNINICWVCFMMHCKSSLFHPIFILFISFTYFVCHTACFYEESNKWINRCQ